MTTILFGESAARQRRVVYGAAVLAVVAGLGLAACGDDDDISTAQPGDPSTEGGPRTVEIAMTDNAFDPTQVEVEAGETVRFVFDNEGAVAHDALIGDEMAQTRHEDEMRAAEETSGEMDGMGHESDDGGAITVEPGETSELTHTFDADDELLIGCHEPGHYDAGMKLSVDVAGG